ncbi:MAG: transcription antitermination factor NusB [Lachnospiraceae bacterium]|nr:transcription antitermination factor NusB [Lachnospiraceae bacterium]MBQ4069443.1 transcription antitermination factor NusB [Lachnospiraceae bacterium]
MTRTELREKTFMLLFRNDFHDGDEMPEQVELYFETQGITIEGKDREYVENKVKDIILHMSELDKDIDNASESWELNRIDKVSLTILRLAYYEIKYEEDVPEGVAINEAVELAKKFGQDDSSAFVNGVLGKLVNA